MTETTMTLDEAHAELAEVIPAKRAIEKKGPGDFDTFEDYQDALAPLKEREAAAEAVRAAHGFTISRAVEIVAEKGAPG